MSVTRNLPSLATGIDLALTAMNNGERKEFLLIVVDYQPDGVTLKTVGNVTNPVNVVLVGKHLIEMAKQEPSLDPLEDLEVRGHA